MFSRKKVARWSGYTVFWGWNVAFLALTLLGILPMIGVGLIQAALSGVLPLNFVIMLLLLVIVPAGSLWIAHNKFTGRPDLQIRLFYGVEAPLFILALIRLFALRELTAASAFLLISIIASALIYGYLLLREASDAYRFSPRETPLSALLLIISLYAGTLLALYAVPVGWEFLTFIARLEWLTALYELFTTPKRLAIFLGMFWWIPFATLFFALTLALFIGTPIAMVRFYGSMWWRKVRQTSRQSALIATTGVAVLWLACFIWIDKQPQQQVFGWFEAQKQVSAGERKAFLLSRATEIREGLRNAYLYPYRYVSVKKDVNLMSMLYYRTFGGTRSDYTWTDILTQTLLSPILYDGDSYDDQKAAELYAAMFDAPIQRAERRQITDALRATSDRDQMEAGLLDVNRRQVRLEAQTITTARNATAADVEIHEVYANQTPQQQEIFYYFSLPSNSAVTGLWLGESADKSHAHSCLISPRGAAQKVYKQEFRRRIDPALLEQVGPRQYRLRVFPVPPAPRRAPGTATGNIPKLHLWMTYRTLGQNRVLPDLLEKRNVYWDAQSKRRLNGSVIKTTSWMPPLAATDAAAATVTLPHGIRYTTILPKPVTTPVDVALLIDTSYSMGQNRDRLADAIAFFKARANRLTIFTVDENRSVVDGLDSLTYFGQLSDSKLWRHAADISDRYDAVFVLTDRGSYELNRDDSNSKTPPAQSANTEFSSAEAQPRLKSSRIWFVHLDQLAPAYEDTVMRSIMQHGGVAATAREAWQAYRANASLPPSQRVEDAVLWDFGTCDATAHFNLQGHPVAAARLIDHLVRCRHGRPDLARLDTLHTIAKANTIVTPYSSMIVLINDRQKEDLKAAEAQDDRFDRPVESGVETLSKPGELLVSGVPEPEEWLLMVVAALLLYQVRGKQYRVH